MIYIKPEPSPRSTVGTSRGTDEETRLDDGCVGRVDGICLRRFGLRRILRALKAASVGGLFLIHFHK
jgi:hypothetical protein